MEFDLKPTHLENALVKLIPLQITDFELLYKVASDPLIWEQHPNPDRYKREVFENFYRGAVESNSAFVIYDSKSLQPIGSSRFYDYDEEKSVIAIGYTFLARNYWGSTYNQSIKALMLNYAFQHVDAVIFHIGTDNIRSQKAITKLSAVKCDEIEMSYYGEPSKLNYIYKIMKPEWLSNPLSFEL